MNQFKFWSAILIVALTTVGCQRKAVEAVAPHETAAGAATDKAVITNAFKISVATGGGVTGLTKGYTLHSTGVVQHWQRFPAQEDSVLWQTTVNPAEIFTLKQQLAASGMLEVTHRETGNMTTAVTFVNEDGAHGWSWPGVGVTERTPANIEDWYKTVDAFCKKLGEEF